MEETEVNPGLDKADTVELRCRYIQIKHFV